MLWDVVWVCLSARILVILREYNIILTILIFYNLVINLNAITVHEQC
jgi:hypothetical protein